MVLGTAAVTGCIAGGVVAAALAGWGMRRIGAPAGAAALAGAGLGAGTFCELSALASGVTYHARSAAAPLALLGMAGVPALAGALLTRRPLTMAPAGLAWLIATVAAVCMLPAALSPTLGGAPIAAMLGGAWWLVAALIPVLMVIAVRGPAKAGLTLVTLLLTGAVVGWDIDPLLSRSGARAWPLGWPALLAALAILGLVWIKQAGATPAGKPGVPRRERSRRTPLIVGFSTALSLAFIGWLILGMAIPPTLDSIRRAASGGFEDGKRLRDDAARRPDIWQEAVTQGLRDDHPPVRALAAGMVRAGAAVSPEAIVAGCTSGTAEARSQVGSIAGMVADRLELAAVLHGIAVEQQNTLIHDMIANDLGAPLQERWSACVGVGPEQHYWQQFIDRAHDDAQLVAMLSRCIEAEDAAVQLRGWRWASLRSLTLPPAAVVRGLASSDQDIRQRAESALRAGSWWKDPDISAAVTARACAEKGRCGELVRQALQEGRLEAERQTMVRAVWLEALAAGPPSAPQACLALLAEREGETTAFTAAFDRSLVLAALVRRTEMGWPDDAMPAVLVGLSRHGLVDMSGIADLCRRRLEQTAWPDGRALNREELGKARSDVVDVADELNERCTPLIWTLAIRHAGRRGVPWFELEDWLMSCAPASAADPVLIDAMWTALPTLPDKDGVRPLAKARARGGLPPERVQIGVASLIDIAGGNGDGSKNASYQLVHLARSGLLSAEQHPVLLAAAVNANNPMLLRSSAIRALLESGADYESITKPAGEVWPPSLQSIIDEHPKNNAIKDLK